MSIIVLSALVDAVKVTLGPKGRNVIIEKTLRGCGIGRKMIGVMLKFCFEKYRLPKVNISVFSHNIPALVLYSRLGFTPVELEERQDFSGQKTVMIHMTLPRKNRRRQILSFTVSLSPP